VTVRSANDGLAGVVKMGGTGLLGGTFDPIHHGHLAVARAVRDQLALDRVLLIPASRPPHKLHIPITPFALRSEMIRAALVDDPTLTLSLIEQETNGPSYSIDTLERLASGIDLFSSYFIIGADAFADFPSWKRFRDILAFTNLVVVNRDEAMGQPQSVIDRYFPELRRDSAGIWSGGSCPGVIRVVTMPQVDISSTSLREMVRCGDDISSLVPDGVAVIIARSGLYKA